MTRKTSAQTRETVITRGQPQSLRVYSNFQGLRARLPRILADVAALVAGGYRKIFIK
jgi:hypothetical protein